VRDLADWVLHAAESELSGPYDLVNPVGDSTNGSFLVAAPLPLLGPSRDGNDGLLSTDVSRALASGLRCRPIEETVNDTWTWLQANPDLDHPTFGLDPAREQSLADLARRT